MKIDEFGKSFIKKWEGGQSRDGLFYIYADAVNKKTIGYGHLIKNGESFSVLNKAQADDLFDRDVIQFEDAINLLASQASVTFNQNQFNALVAFAFNVGTGFLNGSSVKEFKQSKDMSVLANMIRQYVGGSTQDSKVINQTILVNMSKENLEILNKSLSVTNSIDLEVFNVDSLPNELVNGVKKLITDKEASVVEQKTYLNTTATDALKDALGHNEQIIGNK
jgi:GH24 family phage-related lysozyme (muramidase)